MRSASERTLNPGEDERGGRGERERLTLLDGAELLLEVDVEGGSGHVFLWRGERRAGQARNDRQAWPRSSGGSRTTGRGPLLGTG